MNPKGIGMSKTCELEQVKRETVTNRIERLIEIAVETNERLKTVNHVIDGSGENDAACGSQQETRDITSLLCTLERTIGESNHHAHEIQLKL